MFAPRKKISPGDMQQDNPHDNQIKQGLTGLRRDGNPQLQHGCVSLYQKLRNASWQGFTLAEVLLSAIIFAFVITGILASYVTFMALNENSRNTARAIFEARKKIEYMIFVPNVDPAPIQPIYDPVNGFVGVAQVQKTEILIGGIGSGLYNVRVAVSWAEKGGRIIGEAIYDAPNSLTWNSSLGDGDQDMDSPVVIEATVSELY